MQRRYRGSVADRVQPRLACQLHTNRFLLCTPGLPSRRSRWASAVPALLTKPYKFLRREATGCKDRVYTSGLATAQSPLGVVIKLLFMVQACNIDLCVGVGREAGPTPKPTPCVQLRLPPYRYLSNNHHGRHWKSNQCSPPNPVS
jgi:hypothetical protein